MLAEKYTPGFYI